MLHPKLDKWRNARRMSGTLFFASALVDMLFDYTIDPYKASVLNSHTRARELASMAEQLAEGRAVPTSLQPLVHELRDSISHDICVSDASRRFCQTLLNTIEQKLGVDPKHSIDIRSDVEAIVHRIESRYWETLCSNLLHTATTSDKRSTALHLADALIAEVEARGFDRRYVYHMAREFFFDPLSEPNQISAPAQIAAFLQHFEQHPRAWVVVYKASKRLLRYATHARRIGLVIRESFESQWTPFPLWQHSDEEYSEFVTADNRFPLYVAIEIKKALDPYSARIQAEYRMQLLADVCTFHDHTSRLTWSGYVLVADHRGQYSRVHRPQPNVLHFGLLRSQDDQPSGAEQIGRTIQMLLSQRLHPDDGARLFTALEYHRSALRAPRKEGQLLDLWALVEGFVSAPRAGQPRLPHYRKYLVGAAGLLYGQRIIRSVADALRTAGDFIVSHVEQAVPGQHWLVQVATLLCCDDLKNARMSLYALLDDHPLLKYRCFQVHERFESPRQMYNALKNYSQRVEWQINRIYLMRNQIVHNATAFSYLGALVENLHTYVDCLLGAAAETLWHAKRPMRIQASLESLDNTFQNVLERLKQESTAFSSAGFVSHELSPLRSVRELMTG